MATLEGEKLAIIASATIRMFLLQDIQCSTQLFTWKVIVENKKNGDGISKTISSVHLTESIVAALVLF